jgi:integrase
MKRTEALELARQVLRRKHMALATEENYLHWISRFFHWLKDNPDPAPPAKRMEGFLTMLAQKDVAARTQNQAFCAILFFYKQVLGTDPGPVDALRAKSPKFLRHAPSKEVVSRLIAAAEDSPAHPFRLIFMLLYGCGLRVSEPLAIRIRDLDLGARRILIRHAKGAKDRSVTIPACLLEPLQRQIAAARVTWMRAVSSGVPVKLPNQLAVKYRSAAGQFAWFWLLPMANACDDPRDGRRVWWHCLPGAVQKAMRRASAKAGLDGMVRPHDLRHAWATHAHDAGASIRDIQEILGHQSLETTMIYVHPEIERVPSPLEALGNLRIA